MSVESNLEKTVDSIKISVELFHEDKRKTTKEYILYLDDMETVNLETIKGSIVKDLERLEKLDTVKNALTSKIGLVI